MDKYRSYLWREVTNDNIWRIQTPDPKIRKLNRRKSASLVGGKSSNGGL